MVSIFNAIFDGLDLNLGYLSGIFLAYQPAMIVDQWTENTNFMASSVSLELSKCQGPKDYIERVYQMSMTFGTPFQ